MIRLLMLSDFTESYANNLLKGIMAYSRGREPWVVCRMPSSFRRVGDIGKVVEWAEKWEADAIIGQFDENDDVELFQKHGILALAQDFKERFTTVANITGDYFRQGRNAAKFLMGKGFKSFAFYGYASAVWSRERRDGFCRHIVEMGLERPSVYERQSLENLWYYDAQPLSDWVRSLPHPTAVFACDDTRANVILEICRLLGLNVPNDIAILGVDDDEITCSLSFPTLSSISLDAFRGGRDAAEYIERRLHDKSLPPHDIEVGMTGIVERQSTDVFATKNKYIQKVLAFIHQHYSESLPINRLLGVVPMSRRLLENTFKQETGSTIHQYIIYLRLSKMAHLLETTNVPVADLALETGLSDAKNVAHLFNQHYGVTPQQYRQRHGRK